MQPFPRRRRIYLMRHGDVSYFPNGRPVPPESVTLNDEGHAQADIAFDRMVSSEIGT
jgi:broad specificity phosphatase PhoE